VVSRSFETFSLAFVEGIIKAAQGWFILTRRLRRGKSVSLARGRGVETFSGEAKRMADESKSDEATRGSATGAADAEDKHDEGGTTTGARETGDLTGATSTHAGAGGVMENNGGTGTAPNE
jgi:hypothetical protein